MIIVGSPVDEKIPKLADGPEVQPDELVTVKLYVPAARPEIILVVPLPAVVMPPGVSVKVHDPVAGKSSSSTLPVGVSLVG